MTPDQVKAIRENIYLKYNMLHKQMKELQTICEHPNATKKHESVIWDRTQPIGCNLDNTYWTDFDCPDCGKHWNEVGHV